MNVLYVTTVSETINAFLIPHIRMLVEEGHTVNIACRITTPLSQELHELGCQVNDVSFQRTPFSSANITAYKQLTILLSNGQYDVVHCHTPVASTLTRFACRRLRNNGTRVIYTAHGFHFYQGAPLKNWLTYYPIEWICAHFTDVLITINQEDYALAKRRMKAGKIEHVPGIGIDLSRFQAPVFDRIKIREHLGFKNDAILLLSVGELNDNKNHEIAIQAVAKMKDQRLHYMIAGEGELKKHLEIVSSKLDISNQVHLLGLRNDVPALCKAADIFIFPSRREGLPVALMEAMASGLPIICSNVRGIIDLIEDHKGGYLFSPVKVDALAEAIYQMLISKDNKKMGAYNQSKINQFAISRVLREMKRIYGYL